MGKNIRQVIFGDYVATPVKNAFNNKTSYWMSRKGRTLSMYMFTVENGDTIKEFEQKLSPEGLKQYIPMFEERLVRPFDRKAYEDFYRQLQEGEL